MSVGQRGTTSVHISGPHGDCACRTDPTDLTEVPWPMKKAADTTPLRRNCHQIFPLPCAATGSGVQFDPRAIQGRPKNDRLSDGRKFRKEARSGGLPDPPLSVVALETLSQGGSRWSILGFPLVGGHARSILLKRPPASVIKASGTKRTGRQAKEASPVYPRKGQTGYPIAALFVPSAQ